MEIVFLYIFCFISVLSALGVLLLKNLLHAVLCFSITLISVAVLFLYGQAEFLAVSQLMIYAGGILILIVFGLMLTSKIGSKQSNTNNSNLWSTVLLGLVLFGFFSNKILKLDISIVPQHQVASIPKIGYLLLTEHLFTFEMITILLVISLIGAAIISKGLKDDSHAD